MQLDKMAYLFSIDPINPMLPYISLRDNGQQVRGGLCHILTGEWILSRINLTEKKQ